MTLITYGHSLQKSQIQATMQPFRTLNHLPCKNWNPYEVEKHFLSPLKPNYPAHLHTKYPMHHVFLRKDTACFQIYSSRCYYVQLTCKCIQKVSDDGRRASNSAFCVAQLKTHFHDWKQDWEAMFTIVSLVHTLSSHRLCLRGEGGSSMQPPRCKTLYMLWRCNRHQHHYSLV